MEDVNDDFSRLSSKEVAENRIKLLSKIQEQIHSAIVTLNSGRDLLSVKKNVECILQRISGNLAVIKTSWKEEGNVLTGNLVINDIKWLAISIAFSFRELN